jgi:DNA-binding IclR family transcriptional regulator
MGSAAPQGGTQAVDRAAALIDLVVRAEDPPSFTELSDETGLARSTTSRLLAALERTDLVERDASGGYVAGPLFALHAAVHDPWPQVARIARPVLVEVGARTGETVHLGVARGDAVVHVGQVESTFLLSARDWNQVDVPPHCSSLGKVLYAFGVLPLPSGRLERRTDHTVTTRDALAAELATIRRTRYAATVDELETGLTGIAAPVDGRDGVICAIGVSGPTARLQHRVDAIGHLLVEQADRLSTLLGGPSRRVSSRRRPFDASAGPPTDRRADFPADPGADSPADPRADSPVDPSAGHPVGTPAGPPTHSPTQSSTKEGAA